MSVSWLPLSSRHVHREQLVSAEYKRRLAGFGKAFHGVACDFSGEDTFGEMAGLLVCDFPLNRKRGFLCPLLLLLPFLPPKSSVVVNTDCRLLWIWNQLKDKTRLWGPVRGLLEGLAEERRPHHIGGSFWSAAQI